MKTTKTPASSIGKAVNLNLSATQALTLEKLLENEIQAHKNWIASSVEAAARSHDDDEKADANFRSINLVKDLRRLEDLAAHVRRCFREQTGLMTCDVELDRPF